MEIKFFGSHVVFGISTLLEFLNLPTTLIYLSNGTIKKDSFQNRLVVVSIVTEIEVLGYHNLSPKEKTEFIEFFKNTEVIPISTEIKELAIALRQKSKIKLADSIIAATALARNIPLVTVNENDFKKIKELIIINPLKK